MVIIIIISKKKKRKVSQSHIHSNRMGYNNKTLMIVDDTPNTFPFFG